MSYQQRAVLMSERVLGIDHPNTITEYVRFLLLVRLCVHFVVPIMDEFTLIILVYISLGVLLRIEHVFLCSL